MSSKGLVISLVSVLVLAGAPVFGQSQQDQKAAMEAYMKLMAPTENHQFLESFAGAWTIMTKAWMQPGAEPEVSQNSAAAEMILDGRFLRTEYKGAMFGQPFAGIQISGYDTLKKKHTTFWIDSSSTIFYLTEGTRTGQAITETGAWPDPMTGGTSKVRTVMTLVGPDEYLYELYMVGPDGQEFKSLENRAVRKK